jgi:S1-C subfamily serine protease
MLPFIVSKTPTKATLLLVMTVLVPAVSAQSAAKAVSGMDAARVFAKNSGAVVTIKTESGSGSGVIVDPRGVIATNLHVVQGDSRATVTLANHVAYDVTGVIAVDFEKDLILLKIDASALPSAAFGNSDKLSIGRTVYTIGAPHGLELTLSRGIISGLRDSGRGYRVVQTDAAIAPGSSGGGLFDDNGELVGITIGGIPDGNSLNFAVPANYVRRMLTAAATPKLTLADVAGLPTLVNTRLCRRLETDEGEWNCERAASPVTAGSLTFLTRVKSAKDTTVQHRWYRGQELMRSVQLKIAANPTEGYRTYSRYQVNAGAAEWRIELRASDGTLLHEEKFSVR